MKFHWRTEQIRTNEDAREMMRIFREVKPRICCLDTETDGLHIIHSKPFLVQWGFVDEQNWNGYSYAVDLERQPELGYQVLIAWTKVSATVERLIGHNLKFDLHMLRNIGFDYRTENVSDTMFYIRYGHDAVQEDKGGPPLKLKEYAARYITPNARFHEQALDQERTQIAKELNDRLFKVYLKGLRRKDLEPFFKDHCNDPEELPAKQSTAYAAWVQQLPAWIKGRFTNLIESEDIPYTVLNREQVIRYALQDIVLTLEVFYLLEPVVLKRENMLAVEYENKLIYPLVDMERVGFETDRQYLLDTKARMKQYIRERRRELHALAKVSVTINQHELIRELLGTQFGIVCGTTKSEELTRLESDLRHTGKNPDAANFISLVQELRTLEKWYSTYILRFLRNLQGTDRLYTTINSVGTISGRVTSDFQQFPKDPIEDNQGRELFNPRRMVKVSGGDYDGLVYLDYSQIELRVQAMYTILVGHPEPNLCRAYMPFECVDADGFEFNYHRPEELRQWNKPGWFLKEKRDVPWTPVDIHGATACYAFDITPEDPHFKKYRSMGKRINFSKNYGAQKKRIREMFPEYDEAKIEKINDAYYKAFPGVKAYHDYCYRLSRASSYAVNLFGVRYYNVPGHNLINILIQGTSAFFLKWKIRQLWEYSQAHHIQSRLQMQIHDELSWEKHHDEADVFFEFKAIMEEWPDTLVPIVAEMEASRTTWADKKPVHGVEDLR